jgi:tetratricopeptide (TPR) repeat protein
MYQHAIQFYKPIEVLEDELTDQYWISMAACYRGMKEFHEAEKCYRAVVELDPNHAAARAELAKMLADDMNEKDKAMVIIRDLIAMGRKDIIRKERLEMPPVNPRESARKDKKASEAASICKTARNQEESRPDGPGRRCRFWQ